MNRAIEIVFGPFRFIPARQLLLEGDREVSIGSRSRELLSALLERPGEVIAKSDLMARVWPQTHVVEGSLRVHLAALRRAIGDGQPGRRFIINIPGAGYCFVAPVTVIDQMTVGQPAAANALPSDLLLTAGRVIGRSDVVAALGAQLLQHRFVTIVGAGGIGKTTVAAAISETIGERFRDGVRFLDFAPLGDAGLVESALASRLGVSVRSDRPMSSVIAFLQDKDILIVLDGCEHLIEAAAILAEEILLSTRRTAILATSRESLRVKGERVHRLAPLGFAAKTTGLTASEALAFPSVQLFVDRASECLDSFVLLGNQEAPLVADICRRLDGIPRPPSRLRRATSAPSGVAGLASRLGDRMRLPDEGAAHGTPTPPYAHCDARLELRSTFGDRAHSPLPACRIRGNFSPELAGAVLADDRMTAPVAIDVVADLVAKSRVLVRLVGVPFFRLLDTTCAYALGKLEESGERRTFAGAPATISACSKRRPSTGRRSPCRTGTPSTAI